MNFLIIISNISRFQILLKVPYPNISSNKIKSRQISNPKWYNYATCLEIKQSYGRIVRSDTDYGDTFILDSCFSDLLKIRHISQDGLLMQ